MSKVKSKEVVTPEDTYNLTVSYIAQGRVQKDCIESLGISKPTYYEHLTKMGTDWKSLKSQYTSEQPKSKGKLDPPKYMPLGNGAYTSHPNELSTSHPTHNIPPPPPVGLNAGTSSFPSLPKAFQTLLSIAPTLKDVPSWMGPLVVEQIRNIQIQEGKKRIIIRPPAFHPKQHELIESILDPKVKLIACQGAQRSGKSTGVMEGLHEWSLIDPIPRKWLLLAGKGGQSGKDGGAKGILADLLRDQYLEENNIKLLNLGNRTIDSVQWHSGHRLTATDLTVAAIKGGDQDLVWIDEMDVAIKGGRDKREAVVSAINTMLAVPHFKLILTSNLDKGIYVSLINDITELAVDKEAVKMINIYKTDCPHLMRKEVAENYEIAQVFNKNLLDGGMAKMRLDGIMSYEGDIFDQQSIKDAFDIYETLISQSFNDPDAFWLETEYNILSIDPSGTGHPYGWFVGGVHQNYFIEIDSGEMELGFDDTGQKWSSDRVNMFLYNIVKKYNVKYVVLENNTGGPTIYIFFRGKGFRKIEYQNFGKEGNSNARSNFISVVRHALDNRAVALKNRSLHPQLTIYDPDQRDKTDRRVSQKGDLADAFIHFMFKAAGGLKYIPNQKPMLSQEVRIL